MLKSSNLKRISHVCNAINYQLDQFNNARAVKDFTVNGVLAQLKEVTLRNRKSLQLKKEERREIELLQLPLRKSKRLLLNQKFKFQKSLMEKLQNQKKLNKRRKRKLYKLQLHTLLLVATRNVNQELLKHFLSDVFSEIS